MSSEKYISEIRTKGIIEQIHGHQGRINLGRSFCEGCSKGSCFSATENRWVDVLLDEKKFKVGEEVWVLVSPRVGSLAVILLYGVPFIIVISLLFSMIKLGFGEGLSGMVSLMSVIFYFVVLSFFKTRIKDNCQVNIEKL